MGIEILASTKVDVDKDQTAENKSFASMEDHKEIASEVPKGVSNGSTQDIKKEKITFENGVPKDVKEEWPAPQEIHTFYIVKLRSYEDPKLKAKIDQADIDLQKKSQARFQITEKLKEKRRERFEIIEMLKPMTSQEKSYRKLLDEKKKEMEPLQQALGRIKSANIAAREKGQGLCSSEAELERTIQNLRFNIEHGSNTLAEETKMVKEIQRLEKTRDKVIALEAMQAKLQETAGEKEALQGHVKNLGSDLDTVRKEQQAAWNKIKPLEEKLKGVDAQIAALQEELNVAVQKREKAYETLLQLRKERDAGNLPYFQYRSILNNAKEMASKKDVAALRNFSLKEVEEFMSKWNSNKSFRDDYEKKLLSSLSYRQLSKDGRMRNPDEKPLVPELKPGVETGVDKKDLKKEEASSKSALPQNNNVQATAKENQKQLTESVKGKKSMRSPTHDVVESDKPTETTITERSAEDAEAEALLLKEKRREEEMYKAKLALERKKKLAEKAQAKAALKAQKEAEKKQKEREKKARKKAGAALAAGQDSEANPEPISENAAQVQEASVVDEVKTKENEPNEKLKHRKRDVAVKPRVKPPFPKSALKKKKALPTWAWAGLAIALLFLIIIAFLYSRSS
eukprot:TRINITY_DN1486_c0_g1_i1.p1 TRINITY_DN1486_c0_g1~~TRINITY_DN1486_c0_g1_i1.p1  ORF type:complete len:627 (+),score=194.49 TRINITY_DN1486_c0_g1_i1:215-2095(+)